jgi:hypothetical protein
MFLFNVVLFLSSLVYPVPQPGCVGIPLSQVEFNNSVDRINELYSSGNISLKRDFILSVRIYNTITLDRMINENERYKLFYDNFTTEYFPKTVEKLKASLSKGMTFYSKKYDLYIGGQRHANSAFCLML